MDGHTQDFILGTGEWGIGKAVSDWRRGQMWGLGVNSARVSQGIWKHNIFGYSHASKHLKMIP